MTQDEINDIKYEIVNRLVADGILPDCTDTDLEDEVDAENIIEEVLTEKLGITK